MFLDQAVVYDTETFPNCFTLAAESLNNREVGFWEISHRRDDRKHLLEWLYYLSRTGTPMIGFNNLHFDYAVVHELLKNPSITVEQLYTKAMTIIESKNQFEGMIWPSDRLIPQIDLYKIYHFDNKAKSTSLKWLQINMRSASVVDMPVQVGTVLNDYQIDGSLKPYNIHDTSKTKNFALYSLKALEFRVELISEFGVDVMNWNDTKIGERMVINKLGKDLCYDYSSGRKQTRQTVRTHIALNDIIFPYVRFEHPEFNRVLEYLRGQILTKDEFSDDKKIKTKGVFAGLTANVGGLEFHFGVGGIHGSLERKRFQSSNDWLIKDIDVAALYPSIAIQNQLSPAHLGQPFVSVYSELPKERKKWQQEKGKKCVEANALKLASNGVYGKSNSPFSPFYDPQFTMSVTINGQLMLCMLAEQLVKVPTLQMIQINTDGMTYLVHKDYLHYTQQIEKWWEGYTCLVLEEAFYSRMFIRDVNSYIAEDTEGFLKLKGAYWHPDPMRYHEAMSEEQPPAWHKNLSNIASIRAAIANMVHGVDVMTWLKIHSDPYDFMCAVKAKGKDKLYHGSQEVQKTSRYYVSLNGESLNKIAEPAGPLGMPKRKNGVKEHEYLSVMEQVGWVWDERVCTKNKSLYEMRNTSVCAGFNTSICNNVSDFDWSNVNYEWYKNEAEKLIV